MTDIVERLRSEARGSYRDWNYLVETMRQAADEIERLREMLRAALGESDE